MVFGGLPGTGKSSIARELARRLDAVYLRIDTIEQAIRNSPGVTQAVNEEGYRVAYAVAEDNLMLGRIVISDSVNPVRDSRDAWLALGNRSNSRVVEVEVICSDVACHRERVEARESDIPGLKLPTWEKVMAREYERWDRDHVAVDTAGRGVLECVEEIELAIGRVSRGSRT